MSREQKCITVLNFIKICQTVAEISGFFEGGGREGVHTGTVSLVTVVGDPAVLVTITDELVHDTAPVVTLEITGVPAVRRCITTPQ